MISGEFVVPNDLSLAMGCKQLTVEPKGKQTMTAAPMRPPNRGAGTAKEEKAVNRVGSLMSLQAASSEGWQFLECILSSHIFIMMLILFSAYSV